MKRLYSLSLLLLGACLACGASPLSAAAQDSASIDLGKPYPYTITTGMLCFSKDDLKKALDAIEKDAPPPDVQCIALPDGYSQDATATPVEHYVNGDIDGIITEYTVPDGRDPAYGIVKLEAKPASVGDAI